ncbi:MAG: omptin family outer membrane protease [Candidatus Methylomirabilia bacterium]
MTTRLRRFSLPALALAAALVASVPGPARAMRPAGRTGPGSAQTTAAGFSLSLDASVGLLEGSAGELVYYYPYGRKTKLSELTWDLKDVVMAGVHGSVGYGRWLRLNLGVSSALTEGNGTMVDRDWAYDRRLAAFRDLEPNDQNWTHESRHPDTSLDKGTMVDLNLSVLALPAGPFSLRGIVGYKNDAWSWTARGGTYVYSRYGFRDATGTIPAGLAVITYEQKYSIPYIGLAASLAWPSFQLESRLLFSTLVSASDSDSHLMRGVRFDGEFSKGTYVGVGVDATWAFARHWAATLGVEYQTIQEIVGDFTKTGAEGYGVYQDSGGVAMSALLVTLGAGYRF